MFDGIFEPAAPRRTPRPDIRKWLTEFEATVGSIVANVSASAVQLEAAAGTLTRTAETTQSLSSQAASASEEASSNMQSVASATEELSASVDEIGRRSIAELLIQADLFKFIVKRISLSQIVRIAKLTDKVGCP